MFDVAQVRSDFPQLTADVNGAHLVYLDNAATTLKPRPVIDTITNYYSCLSANVHRGAHHLSTEGTNLFESARATIAKFINANESDEVVFTRGTTESINLVASSYGQGFLAAGDEVVLSELEHHSNIVTLQLLAKEKNLVIKVIPVDDRGDLIFSKFQELLSPRTKVVSLTACSNALGTLVPVKDYVAEAKKHGAIVMVDAAQSVSLVATDVQAWGCDFIAFSGHKLFGPTGIGVLWGKKDLLAKMPPYQGGGSMIDRVTFAEATFLPPPQRFEAGTPHIAGAIGLGEAIKYFQTLPIEDVHSYERSLMLSATEQLKKIPGLRIMGESKTKANIVSFVIDGIHPMDIGSLVDQQGVAVRVGHHCAQPVMDRFKVPGTVRASFSLYNNEQEVELLVAAVKKAKEFF